MDSNSAIKFFKPLKDYWDKLEKQKRIMFGVAVAAVLLVIIVSVLLLNNTKYTVLYSGLDSAEAGKILTALTDKGVKAKPQGTGTILVPEDQADQLRMEMATEGYPESGLNYDMFKNSTGFGTTDYEKQKYMQFQLQDRLQVAIKSLSAIDDAIVTLYIPESTSFVLKSDKQDASASVILKLKNSATLSKAQVKGIVGLVAKSVPGLTEDQVLVIDSDGNTLNTLDANQTELAGTQLELEEKVSDKYKEQIQSMLEPVFGTGKVIAGVRVSLNFDKQSTESTRVEPVDGGTNGIPVSTNDTKETATGSSTAGNVGMDANGGAPTYPETNSGGGTYSKTEKTVNYEISKIKDMVQKAEGNIDDISVSIILDNANLQSGAEDKVKSIVAGATGIDPNNVTVQTMNFDGESTSGSIASMFDSQNTARQQQLRQRIVFNIILFGAIAILLIVIVVLILRHNKKIKEMERLQALAEEEAARAAVATEEEEPVEFTMKKSEQRKLIEKNIESNPEFVAQLLRSWLDDYGN